MADNDSPRQIRVSDAERAQTAHTLSTALAEGRLTPPEADERLAACWAARYDGELAQLTADLPTPSPAAPQPVAPARVWSGPLLAHAAIAAVLSTLLIVGWSAGGGRPEFDGPRQFAADHANFFWPIFPIFWLAVSVAVHAGIRIRQRNLGQATTRRLSGW